MGGNSVSIVNSMFGCLQDTLFGTCCFMSAEITGSHILLHLIIVLPLHTHTKMLAFAQNIVTCDLTGNLRNGNCDTKDIGLSGGIGKKSNN